MTGTCGDTDDEAARVHLQLLRAASPAARLALALSLSRSVIELSRQGIRRGLGGAASDEEVDVRFVELHYGPHLAEALRRVLAARTR